MKVMILHHPRLLKKNGKKNDTQILQNCQITISIYETVISKKKDNNYPQKKTVKITTSGTVCIKL